MRILVTNDDGVDAPGLEVLESVAAQLSDDVWVVAPASEQTGAGHSLTLHAPLRYRRLSERRFAVAGSPTDCVLMAVGHILKDKRPDVLLSGVNFGANLAEDVTYSGTVSAAMEGALVGIPSIALSQALVPSHASGELALGPPRLEQFDAARGHAVSVISKLLRVGWPERVLVSVNFPPVPADQVAGVRVTEQGFRAVAGISIEERKDPRGLSYFWYGFAREVGAPGHETDLKAMREAHISVTPLHLDLTHYPSLEALRSGLTR
jgi:5'-nucleotidase